VVVAWDPVRWQDVPAALWSRRTYLAMAHLITGGLIWVLTTGAMLAAVGLVASKKGPLTVLDPGGYGKPARLVAVLILLPVVPAALLALTARLTRWQRTRFRAVLGVELMPFDPYRPDRRRWRRLAADAVDRRAWGQVGYHAAGGLLTAAATVTAVTGMGVGVMLLGGSIGWHRLPAGERVATAAIGVAFVLAAPWLARGAAAVDLALARALLQPPATEELARRVESLSASRAGAVDAADAERRRIERSLHDGTQQRLVSLAMNLGMTRAALGDARPEVHQAIAKAHEEAKEALAELRDFIRGLHPAVLDELGLDAALSGLAARSPVPVRLSVDLRERPPAAAEAVAYFVVSEALANVARHAGATRTDVAVRQQPEGLFLSVTDDGHGGADPRRGTGLRGLQQRVESVDGTLRIASPAGGPTTIQVTLPCAW
jgi:signal transduction histidine kinase